MGSPTSGLKRFILWDYPRAGWQYDIMVGIILVFIFLTPRDWFRDQARASSIVILPSSERGTSVFLLEPDQLSGVTTSERVNQAAALLKAQRGRRYNVTHVEPIFDAEKEIKGFMAFTTP